MGRYWVKNWIARRQTFGDYHNLMRELEAGNPEDFQAYTHMEPAMFREFLDRIEPRITKQTINMRIPLEPGVKLAITLTYLATGSSYKTLAFAFRVASNTISLFIPEVADAIVSEYGDLVAMPDSQDGWRAVARGFSSRWNFRHCIGAVDGKHIRIVKPGHTIHSGMLWTD